MDLNADLGEGGPSDGELLDVVTSASVACGFHAGDRATMVATARRAVEKGMSVGAHPSYPDREGFGRRPMDLSGDELFAGVLHQIDAMAAAAAAAGAALAYVKPHGALYNQAAVETRVAEPLVQAVASGGMPILCPIGSEMERMARRAGLAVYREAFPDRRYRPDGTLVPRGHPGAVIEDLAEVAQRAVRMAVEGEITTEGGSVIRIAPDSICIHGDTPGALDLARSVRRALEDAGVLLRPFVSL